jgi:hypothetical protein
LGLRPVLPLALVFAGVLLLLSGAFTDEVRQARHPWGHSAMAVGETPPFPETGAVSVRVRRVPPDQLPSVLALLEEHVPPESLGQTWEEDRAALAAWEARSEFVVLADLPGGPGFDGLLAEGRMPEPGAPEVLAGPLVRIDSFFLGGETFTVTGRISPRAPAFMDAFLLPNHSRWQTIFSEESGGLPGWLTRDASAWLEEVVTGAEEGNTAALTILGDELEAGFAMTERAFTLLGILALALVALGSTLFTTRLAHWLHGLGGLSWLTWLPMPLLDAIVARPRLWWGLHLVNYGILLGMMAVATAYPRMAANLAEWMALVFSEGDLAYVGDAYASKSILAAAGATFTHNFLTATIMMTLLPSLIILGWGVLKTAASLALVGFIMSPLWVGTLSGYTYHSVTMGIEIEAYIIASFAVSVYALQLLRGMLMGEFFDRFVLGLRIVVGAAVVSALYLLAGALYEATTLILFRL